MDMFSLSCKKIEKPLLEFREKPFFLENLKFQWRAATQQSNSTFWNYIAPPGRPRNNLSNKTNRLQIALDSDENDALAKIAIFNLEGVFFYYRFRCIVFSDLTGQRYVVIVRAVNVGVAR